MALKYHDIFAEQVRDGNGELMDNWDPNQDYGNEFAPVTLLCTAQGYGYPDYCPTPAEAERFYAEVTTLLSPLGFRVDGVLSGVTGLDLVRRSEWLNVQPHRIDGELKKNGIREIAETLAKAGTFRFSGVQLYGTCYVMSDAEYRALLMRQKDSIREYILGRCKRTRTLDFCPAKGIAWIAAEQFLVKRIGYSKLDTLRVADKYIRLNVIPELIKDGLLARKEDANNNLLVCTRRIRHVLGSCKNSYMKGAVVS